MSKWTHVIGGLYIDTFKEENDIKTYVENLLKEAPKITGSEQDCDIIVTPLSGYNISGGFDCKNCEYRDTVRYLPDNIGFFTCDAEDDYECPVATYQTCVAVTLVGDLRDRGIEQTKKEIDDFVKYVQDLEQKCYIERCSVLVEDGYGNTSQLTIKYLDNYDIEDKGEFVWKKI